jgi:V/A-type H+-transporting ATPase subunit I
LPVTPLRRVTIFAPRSELPELLKELAAFGPFHPTTPETQRPDDRLSDLATRALRLVNELEEVVGELGLKGEPPFLDVVFRGVTLEVKDYTAEGWVELLEQAEAEARPLLEEVKGLMASIEEAERELQSLVALEDALELVASFTVDLAALDRFRWFGAVFALAAAGEVVEVKRSLPDLLVVETPLKRGAVAFVVVGPRSEWERIDRTLRAFEIKPFTIPSHLPSNPAEAYRKVRAEVEELRAKIEGLRAQLQQRIGEVGESLLNLRELAKAAYQVFDQGRRVGDLRRFARVEGYIPEELTGRFEERFASRWLYVLDGVRGGSTPTLMRNRGPVKAFEQVTLTQGPPRYGELDPTPIIALIFPIFYGFMFGDFGHGLVLSLFGFFLTRRRVESLRRWGVLILATGIAASVMGLIIGEFFGIEIKELAPPLGRLMLVEFVERVHEGAATISMEGLMVLLQAALLLGALHLGLGLLLGVISSLRTGERHQALLERLPAFTLYLFGVVFVLAFIGADYSFDQLFTATTPIPLLGLPAALAGQIGLLGALASMVVMLAGKALEARHHPEGEGVVMAVFIDFIEILFERVPGFLANTVSYARLTILLTVHASLLIALNLAWSLPLYIAVPFIAFINLLIILLEGLIVYIQALRLHIYEWFTKFYSGDGQLFRTLLPQSNRVRIRWS